MGRQLLVYEWIHERLKNKPNTTLLTVLFDDATYSGKQYSQQTAKYSFPNWKFGQRWGKWVHAVMIPYVSEIAKRTIKITDKHNLNGAKLWFPTASEIMHVVEPPNAMATKLRDEPWFSLPSIIPVSSVYYPIFDDKTNAIFNRGMTYFDHKLADHVSVYTFIMKNAPVPDEFPSNKNQMTIGPSFIAKCGPDRVLTGSERDDIVRTAGNLKPECFVPPYKRHQWKYQKRVLDKKNTLVQITNRCVICNRIPDKLFREHGTPETSGRVFCSKECQFVLYH